MTSRHDGSASREALGLPLVFLTVAAVAGFRAPLEGGLQLLPPSLVSLVLALVLLGAMARCGLLRPDLLVGGDRTVLETASGVAVLASLFAATAQVVAALLPEDGVLHVLGCVFFAVLLSTTLAAQPDRPRLLRSLMVLFLWAFVLKYVALNALYDPNAGLTRRVLTTLLEGVSLGGLRYTPFAPVTGYVVFFVLLLYAGGLTLLPSRPVVSGALVRTPEPDEAAIVSGRHPD